MSLTKVHIEAYGSEYDILVHPESHIGKRIIDGKRPYELPLLEDMYNEVDEDATALDVGAHIGNHTLWMAAVCGWEVYAFEPNLDAFMQLCRNTHGMSNVHPRNYALGDENGSAKSISLGRVAYTAIEDEQEFPVLRLDSMLEMGKLSGRVAIIKIDVEGWEPRVIKGARNLITEHQPTIYAEARDELAFKKNLAELRPLGYERIHRFHSKLVATPVDKWVYSG